MAQVKKARRKATATRKNAAVPSRSSVPRVRCVGFGDDPASWTPLRRVSEPLVACCSITDGCINPASSFENIFVDQTCNVAIAGYSTDYDGPLAIQVRLDWLATAATGSQELLRLMMQMQYVDRNCEAIAKAMKPVCERAKELMGVE